MRVTIVGAGTLGRVLGVRLARAGAEISFVVRAAVPTQLIIERVDVSERMELTGVVQSQELPAASDVVLVCLPADAMTDALLDRLSRASTPVVLLLPLLPKSWARIGEALSDRGSAGIPGVMGYVRADGVVRYWLPRPAPTTFDASGNLTALSSLLESAGVPSEDAPNVASLNQVVTATLLPMAMGLAAGRTIARVLEDDEFLALVLAAMLESEKLAETLGTAPSWLGLLTKFIGPRMLKVAVGIGERTSQETLHYIEEHFGRTHRSSTVVLADELISLCAERNLATHALAALRARMA